MSVEDIKKLKADKGFTIVELLIVIVVIGILVAIVIVAYTGITQQARNTGYQANASSIQKTAETYNSDVGSYPQTNALISSGTYSKLPADVGVAITTGAVTNTTSSGATDPATANHVWAMYTNTATGKKFYSVRACGASTGLAVYYPIDGNPATAAGVGKINVGSGC